MAVIIPGKLIFLATPRTGSIATANALSELPNAMVTKKMHHANLKEIETTLPSKLGCPSYTRKNEFVFTTVRNHWDILATWWLLSGRQHSLYFFAKKYKHSFFARGNELFWRFKGEVDLYIKYESLEEQLNSVLRSLKLPEVKLKETNSTPNKRPWIDHYSRESYEAVYEQYKKEIHFFNYAFEPYEKLVCQRVAEIG